MNTVQNGKGDRPRNNWGSDWYAGYDAMDFRKKSSCTIHPNKQVRPQRANPQLKKHPLEKRSYKIRPNPVRKGNNYDCNPSPNHTSTTAGSGALVRVT